MAHQWCKLNCSRPVFDKYSGLLLRPRLYLLLAVCLSTQKAATPQQSPESAKLICSLTCPNVSCCSRIKDDEVAINTIRRHTLRRDPKLDYPPRSSTSAKHPLLDLSVLPNRVKPDIT